MIKSSQVNEYIKGIFREWVAKREQIANESYQEAKNNLQPGMMLVQPGPIYGDKFITEFRNECAIAEGKCHGEIEAYRNELFQRKTEAPSEEALRTIQMFAMRCDIGENPSKAAKEKLVKEIDDLMVRYGENYECYMTLLALAKKNGIPHQLVHAVAEELDDCDQADKLVKDMFGSMKRQHNAVTEAEKQVFELYLDSYFEV